MLPVPGSKVRYFGEEALQVSRVLAEFRGSVLQILPVLPVPRVLRLWILSTRSILGVRYLEPSSILGRNPGFYTSSTPGTWKHFGGY